MIEEQANGVFAGDVARRPESVRYPRLAAVGALRAAPGVLWPLGRTGGKVLGPRDPHPARAVKHELVLTGRQRVRRERVRLPVVPGLPRELQLHRLAVDSGLEVAARTDQER